MTASRSYRVGWLPADNEQYNYPFIGAPLLWGAGGAEVSIELLRDAEIATAPADCLVVSYDKLQLLERLNDAQLRRTIVWANNDQACLPCEVVPWLSKIGICFRGVDFVDPDKHRLIYPGNMAHLPASNETPQRRSISDSDLSKIRMLCGPGLAPRVLDSSRIAASSVSQRARGDVVVFAGTLHYGACVGVTAHRRAAIDAVMWFLADTGLPGAVYVTTGAHRALQFADYMQLLLNASVAVSPMGNGEYCYRDFEAGAAGCAVFKPWRHAAYTFPEPRIWAGQTELQMMPEWTDIAWPVERLLPAVCADAVSAGTRHYAAYADDLDYAKCLDVVQARFVSAIEELVLSNPLVG